MRINVLNTEPKEQRREARVERALEEFVGRVKELNVRKVVLFGSTARKEDREDSDVDLLIVGDRGERRKIADIETDLDLKYRLPLVSVMYGDDEPKTPFMREVMKEGRLLYERQN